MNYIKCVGLALACLVLGSVAIALIPLLTVIGMGLLVMFLAYVIYVAATEDIDAEVEAIKEERRSN